MNQTDRYAPPRSDVTPLTPPLPSGGMSSRVPRAGAWLSIALLIITIPYYLASFVPGIFPVAVVMALALITLLLSLSAFYLFVRFIEFRYAVANLWPLFYVISAVTVVLSIVGIPILIDDSSEPSIYTWISVLGLPVFGIPYAMFGYRIKGIQGATSLTTTLGWLQLVSGILTASIVLVLLALPLTFVNLWISAVVLFAGAREIDAARA